MEPDSGHIYTRSLEEANDIINILRRDTVCFQCPSEGTLACPACPDNQECSFSIPTGCDASCAKSQCVAKAAGASSSEADSKESGNGQPSAGAIAGGVIGGIIFIMIATYLVWRFLIKPKRSQMSPSVSEVHQMPAGDLEKDTASRHTRRSSAHTVHSIADTVLTRASNIIQIAYIPGVTNRASPSSPTVLVPPVPPIPMHHAEGNRESEQEEQRFFVPGDLRDSTYSGLSGYSQRTSYARTSYAPRSSVASTIYGKQAHVVNPAQSFMRAKPTVVSVKSMMNNSSASSTVGSTPPVPDIDYDKFARPKSGDSTFSVGSTFLNNANTAMPVRAQVVKVGSVKKSERSSKSDISVVSATSGYVGPPSPETTVGFSVRDSNMTSTVIDDSPVVDQGPFSDPPERPSPGGFSNPSGLGALIEEEAEHARVGDRNSRRLGSTERGSSPFSDDHATR
jgi:hypothetical protein